MLINTFCHLPRIGLNKEKTLWGKGIQSWDDYRKTAKNLDDLDESELHFKNRNAGYFSRSLKSDQQWRLFDDFRDSVAYIDIETTGLDRSYNEITSIALYDGTDLRTYVSGQNLTQFPKDIQQYKVLVSYNGKMFDIPFIERQFGIELDHAHIDLRFVLAKLGYKGGLKGVERAMGIDRGDLDGVDGFFAVWLWGEYKKKKNEAALETLLAYNCTDVVNLEHLAVTAYNQNMKQTPFGSHRQAAAAKPVKIPFQADKKLVSRRSGW